MLYFHNYNVTEVTNFTKYESCMSQPSDIYDDIPISHESFLYKYFPMKTI